MHSVTLRLFHLGVVHKLSWQVFGFFYHPFLWLFLPYKHFWTTFPPLFVNVVCEQTLGRHEKDKVELFLIGSLDSIATPSPSVKIQIMGGKVCLRFLDKTLLGVVNKLFVFKRLLTTPSKLSCPFSLNDKVMRSNPGYFLKSSMRDLS